MDWITQCASETIEPDLCNITLLQYDSFAKRERIGTKEVDMHAAGLPVSGELEVMMLHVGKAVTHILFAAGDLPVPKCHSRSFDTDLSMNISKIRIDDQLRTKAAGSQLRSGKIQVVPLLEFMIRKFVAYHHANAKWCAIVRDQVYAGEFAFFATILCVTGNLERLKWSANCGAIAFVEPLRRYTDLTVGRTTTFDPPLEHTHAVGDVLCLLRRIGDMHCLPLLSASDVG